MDDKQLDQCLSDAENGLVDPEQFAAVALVEIVSRIMEGRAPSRAAGKTFLGAILRTVEQKRAAAFLFGDPPKRPGAPRKHPRRSQLLEALIVAQLLEEGYSALSTERDMAGTSAFVEAARQLGTPKEELYKEAERIKKAWNRGKNPKAQSKKAAKSKRRDKQ
jgi:hypothetical protein